MADSAAGPAPSDSPPRPIVGRNVKSAPNRSVASLNRKPIAGTPIPPRFQELVNAHLANRVGQPVDQTALLMKQMSLGDNNNTHGPTPIGRAQSGPAIRGVAARRLMGGGLKLSSNDIPTLANGFGPGRPVAEQMPKRSPQSNMGTPFANFRTIIDPSGALNFNGKAIVHASGVDFSNGASFSINMSQLELEEELGRGNYGTVKKVLHRPTKVQMAMKEIRLELDEAKLNAIIMELDILHRAVAPEIVDFYGAFFIESCVYYCMEYMDAGSIDTLEGEGVPEPVLGRIAGSMVRGLKFLKDHLQIIHRDVKPTNVLINRKGEVKLCDFGVSGQLERSLAKTNIGCQSYMAPERIYGESQGHLGTYTVSSDIWSLGLAMIEMGLGHYPYPPETYRDVFSQLQAIVHGDPPQLPDDKFSDDAQEFVQLCLHKSPEKRASYAQLLDHPFLVKDRSRQVDMVSWVDGAIRYRQAKLSKLRQQQNQQTSS